MIQPLSLILPISAPDASKIGHARRRALTLARTLGFGDLRLGELAIVVSEAAGNIAAHALEGYLVLTPWKHQGSCGVDLLALDCGKGIADIGRCVEDGYSTSGTPGQGLGAMSRLSANFQIYSIPGEGTAIFARLVQEAPGGDPAAAAAAYGIGSICVPYSGETACGDAWNFHAVPGRSIYMMADGLGHGPMAAEAAEEAIRVFDECAQMPPSEILTAAHAALRKTRGAAVAVAAIDHHSGVLQYAGIGNISGAILSGGKTRSMVSMNGTLGHNIRTIQDFSYPWEKGSTLLMHSDGLTSRWSLPHYPSLTSRHPALIAGVLYRDFSRKHDDVTVLAARP